jgi:hypothetical protein
MEGMNAPMGTFRSLAHSPRAVTVTDRLLAESDPGAYVATVQLPQSGSYDVAFILDAPQILHCFRVEVKPNPSITRDLKSLAIQYLVEDRKVAAGKTFALRFRLTDPATEQPRTGLKDVSVLFYRAPGYDRTEVKAREIETGIYEAPLPIRKDGAYFVYVGSRSAKMPYGDLSYLTLRAL